MAKKEINPRKALLTIGVALMILGALAVLGLLATVLFKIIESSSWFFYPSIIFGIIVFAVGLILKKESKK